MWYIVIQGRLIIHIVCGDINLRIILSSIEESTESDYECYGPFVDKEEAIARSLIYSH